MRFKLSNIGYFFKLAFQGLFRNSVSALATVIVLAAALLVTGSTWALSVNLNHNLEEINEYNKIVVFVSKETEDHTTKLLKEKIEKIDSVESVDWVTKDEVLANLFQDYGDYSDILQMYNDDNPLKDELIITYRDSAKVNDIVYQINYMSEQDDTLGSVDKINDRREVAEKIDELKNVASVVFSGLLILLLSVSYFIITNTIKLAIHSRATEVSIMRYVGASGTFVAFPFILEGIILGLVSSGVAFGLMYSMYDIFALDILGGIDMITILPFSAIVKEIAIGFVSIAVALGVFGSLFSLRKYNRE